MDNGLHNEMTESEWNNQQKLIEIKNTISQISIDDIIHIIQQKNKCFNANEINCLEIDCENCPYDYDADMFNRIMEDVIIDLLKELQTYLDKQIG